MDIDNDMIEYVQDIFGNDSIMDGISVYISARLAKELFGIDSNIQLEKFKGGWKRTK